MPIGAGQIGLEFAEQSPRLAGQELGRLGGRLDRPRCNIKERLLSKFDERLGPRLQTRQSLREALVLTRRQGAGEGLFQPFRHQHH